MEINGITVPDAGTTKQYLPDTVGGWMYVVTTTTSVEQQSLTTIQQQLDDAKEQVRAAQSVVDELEPQVADFKATVKQAPLIETPAATSTSMK